MTTPPSFRCAIVASRICRPSSRALSSCGNGTGIMNSSTSGMPVSRVRVRILKSRPDPVDHLGHDHAIDQPVRVVGHHDQRAGLPGCARFPRAGCRSLMPMWRIALGQNGHADRRARAFKAADQAAGAGPWPSAIRSRGSCRHLERVGEGAGIGQPPHVILARLRGCGRRRHAPRRLVFCISVTTIRLPRQPACPSGPAPQQSSPKRAATKAFQRHRQVPPPAARRFPRQ